MANDVPWRDDSDRNACDIPELGIFGIDDRLKFVDEGGLGHVVEWLVDAQSLTSEPTKRNIFFHLFSFFFLHFFVDRSGKA